MSEEECVHRVQAVLASEGSLLRVVGCVVTLVCSMKPVGELWPATLLWWCHLYIAGSTTSTSQGALLKCM